MAKFKTINDAAHDWVRDLNSYPLDMISKLVSLDIDDWSELTTPRYGDRVYHYESGESGSITKVEHIEKDDLIYTYFDIELDNGETVRVEEDDDTFEVEHDDFLPMWGTMWSFDDSCDDGWLDYGNGIQKMSECGFRIYRSEEFGYFFGIDGAGYDFYEEHWIPLYKARGLHWHETKEAE